MSNFSWLYYVALTEFSMHNSVKWKSSPLETVHQHDQQGSVRKKSFPGLHTAASGGSAVAFFFFTSKPLIMILSHRLHAGHSIIDADSLQQHQNFYGLIGCISCSESPTHVAFAQKGVTKIYWDRKFWSLSITVIKTITSKTAETVCCIAQ